MHSFTSLTSTTSRRVAGPISRLGAPLVVWLSAAAWVAVAQAHPEIPGADQDRPIALVGGTVHTMDGASIEAGAVLFSGGKIVDVGETVSTPEGAEVIDISGKHVYPGLIDANTQLGLVEIPAVRATRDMAETGSLNPNVKAQVAFNPDSELLPVTRSNGVLLALTIPSGGLISGQSALMQLDGWTWEDMTRKSPVGMHVQWPNMAPISAWWMKDSNKSQLAQRDRQLESLTTAFADARAYQKARQSGEHAQPFDARWEAMLPVLDGDMPLIVRADNALQIQAAVAFATREKVRLILHGGYAAPACADLLKAHDVPVILMGVHRLPARRHTAYDDAFTIAERLRTAGVEYCIASGGRWTSNSRNLPYQAAMAAAFGLPPEEALKAITIYPARILGMEDHLGSLTVGKDATLIVTDGNPLEIPTQVERAYVQGRLVQLNDRHKRLWKKYEEKYRRQDASN